MNNMCYIVYIPVIILRCFALASLNIWATSISSSFSSTSSSCTTSNPTSPPQLKPMSCFCLDPPPKITVHVFYIHTFDIEIELELNECTYNKEGFIGLLASKGIQHASNPQHLLPAPKIKMYFVNTYLQCLQHVYDLSYSMYYVYMYYMYSYRITYNFHELLLRHIREIYVHLLPHHPSYCFPLMKSSQPCIC